jgi:hypothetical protein
VNIKKRNDGIIYCEMNTIGFLFNYFSFRLKMTLEIMNYYKEMNNPNSSLHAFLLPNSNKYVPFLNFSFSLCLNTFVREHLNDVNEL